MCAWPGRNWAPTFRLNSTRLVSVPRPRSTDTKMDRDCVRGGVLVFKHRAGYAPPDFEAGGGGGGGVTRMRVSLVSFARKPGEGPPFSWQSATVLALTSLSRASFLLNFLPAASVM